MSFAKTSVVTTALALLSGLAAHADPGGAPPPEYGSDVTIDRAKRIATAVIKECAANHWNMAVAVVDTHGALVYYEKMDNTILSSAKIAQEKAASASLYMRPTRAFFDVTREKGPFMLTMPDVIAAPGGLPLYSNGKVVGAVAASGGTGDQDEQCAKAGLAVH